MERGDEALSDSVIDEAVIAGLMGVADLPSAGQSAGSVGSPILTQEIS